MARDSVLGEIVARKRIDVAARKEADPDLGEVPVSDRSLFEALRAPRTGFVLECKKASPSRGVIRPFLDPVALAQEYAAVADAISVIVDTPYFQGELGWLTAVRAAVDVPVLCKDFVVDPWQVREARSLGADAILLMLSVLDDDEWRACAAEAAALGVDCLTEVHGLSEMERALELEAPIVGINNRDLKTLTIDLAVTERLAPRVPADRVVLCESGIFTHAHVRRLRGQANGFLIGTSLVASEHAGRTAREIAYGRLKVCGLTRPEDAAAAWAAGATWGGLIHAPESKRCVTPDQAAAVRAAAPDLRWVGVFVNAEPEMVAAKATALELSAVQLHGEESKEYVDALRPRLPDGCEVWKAVRIQGVIPSRSATGADRLLLDTYSDTARGGTGERFDWSLVARHDDPQRLILAGGLTPENAAEADALSVWALDVNSGVESAPGRKDAAQVRAFAESLRGAGRVLASGP